MYSNTSEQMNKTSPIKNIVKDRAKSAIEFEPRRTVRLDWEGNFILLYFLYLQLVYVINYIVALQRVRSSWIEIKTGQDYAKK